MLDQSQTCPSCRSSKYSNPQLRLMVNTCGHSLCENCVEVLFVRGSGLCVQCKTPVRKVNFRYQLFEDPLVQKEVEIRKKILSDFNKREDDFDCLEDYDLYLEKIEELVYNLMNDIDVEDCKRYIENYKKENKDIIKKNRLRPSASMLFYETELEREAILREKREREDEERRQNLLKNVAPGNCSTDGECSAVQQQDTPKPPPSSFSRPPTIKPPPSTARPNIQPPSQFFSPASSMCNRLGTDRVFIPPPPSALGGNYVVPPSAIPPSGCSPSVSNWTIGTHHQVLLPSKTTQSPRQPDAVIIPNRSVLVPITLLWKTVRITPFTLCRVNFTRNPTSFMSSDQSEVISETTDLPAIDRDAVLIRSKFNRVIPMLTVGLVCGRDWSKSCAAALPLFHHFVRVPKTVKTYKDSVGALRKLIVIQPPCERPLSAVISELKNSDIEVCPDPYSPTELSSWSIVPELAAPLPANTPDGFCNTAPRLLPEAVASLQRPGSFFLLIGYENIGLDEALKCILPNNASPVNAFTIMGHIAHFNLKEDSLPFRRLIGQVVLDKLPTIRTVIHKAAPINSDFRTFQFDLMAGDPNFVTTVKENNCVFHLDVSKVYWNSRLSTEHSRIVDQLCSPSSVLSNSGPRKTAHFLPSHVVVYDVFAGVGPFAIPAARHGCHVYANDLNPDSYSWLVRNVSANKTRRKQLDCISVFNMDGRQFIRERSGSA